MRSWFHETGTPLVMRKAVVLFQTRASRISIPNIKTNLVIRNVL